MTKRKINKLFGGPKHGLVIRLPLDQHIIVFPETSPPYYPRDFPNSTDLLYRTIHYRRREAILGDNVLYYWAIESASDKEALNMLCNYLLRGSEIIE